MQAFAELDDDGTRICVHFRYTTEVKDAVKSIPGSRFVPADKGGPHWTLPADLISARQLREKFGDGLQVGDGLKAWGKEATKKEAKLRSLSIADDVPVKELAIAKKLPKLAKWFRPYQRADVKYLATTNSLNLLQPRLGKTTETIAAIYEADLENGPHLVVTPSVLSIDLIWRYEYERWTDIPVYSWSGDVSPNERAIALAEIGRHLKAKEAFVFITTPSMIRTGLPRTLDIEWHSYTIDEYHKTGLSEPKNKFHSASLGIKARRKFALSGTPMGGKTIKLWGGLRFTEPESHSSKWRWADTWLEVTEETIRYRNKAGVLVTRKVKTIGDVKKGREDAFDDMLSQHSVRRLREEVLPQLPPVQVIDVLCPMTKKQTKQYQAFADDAEVRIDEYHLSATSILAEYTRLKQFANSYCEVEFLGLDEETGEVKLKLRATPESGKLPYLMDKLAEVGIDPDEPAGTAQAIVASQFKETADMVFDYLTEVGIPCAKITGGVSRKRGREAALAFKEGEDHDGLRVLVMTTDAGGVALTMDNVESVHVLDEKWNPDDQEQLIDRALNTTRLHQVNAFMYRSNKSIESEIHQLTGDKTVTNRNVLDLRRQMRAKRGK
jgi:SNF2 family DNA or RNA helicase